MALGVGSEFWEWVRGCVSRLIAVLAGSRLNEYVQGRLIAWE